MMDEERDLELLDSFLSGQLSDAEMKEVSARLETEPALWAMKDELSQLKSGIESAGRKKLRAKMDDWDSNFGNPLEEKKPKTVGMISWRAYVGWAAILVAGFFSVLWYNSESQRAKRIYNTYYKAFDNIIAPVQRGNDEDGIEIKAFESYEEGDYEKASLLFKQLVELNEADYVLFYSGIVFMELEDWANAEKALMRVGNDFKLQSDWFRALISIRQNDFDKARELLLVLEKGKNSYSKIASEILRKLD